MKIERKTNPPSESLWDSNDVAAYIKASRSWVYMQAQAGRLPHFKVCGFVRFDPEVIRAWVRGENVGAKVVPFPPRPEPK